MTYDLAAAERLRDARCWAEAGLDDEALADEWWSAGFEPDEAGVWLRAVETALAQAGPETPVDSAGVLRIALTFRAARFSADELTGWYDALINEAYERPFEVVHQARRWRAAGFDADTAARWLRPGVYCGDADLRLAVCLENHGWSPWELAALTLLADHTRTDDWASTARDWVELSSPTGLDYAKAGLTPAEAAAFDALNLRPDALRIELRARFDKRPPIDPYRAMHFNHMLFASFDDLPDEQRPWWVQHLRDLHDEAQDREQGERNRQQALADEANAARQEQFQGMLREDGLCRDSGRHGAMDEIPGSDEWYVRCKTCGLKLAGGSTELPDHTPPGYRS